MFLAITSKAEPWEGNESGVAREWKGEGQRTDHPSLQAPGPPANSVKHSAIRLTCSQKPAMPRLWSEQPDRNKGMRTVGWWAGLVTLEKCDIILYPGNGHRGNTKWIRKTEEKERVNIRGGFNMARCPFSSKGWERYGLKYTPTNQQWQHL